MEYDPDLFIMKPPYSILIEISLFSGRTKETKEALFRNIVSDLHQKMGINKEAVFIVLNEQPLDNWGLRGGIQIDEKSLNFMVDI